MKVVRILHRPAKCIRSFRITRRRTPATQRCQAFRAWTTNRAGNSLASFRRSLDNHYSSPLLIRSRPSISSRYTDSVMNSYPPMGVPGSASIAQFYQQAAAVSAASAGVGVDSLGSACSQLSSSVGGGQSGLPDITRHPWLVTGKLCPPDPKNV